MHLFVKAGVGGSGGVYSLVSGRDVQGAAHSRETGYVEPRHSILTHACDREDLKYFWTRKYLTRISCSEIPSR